MHPDSTTPTSGDLGVVHCIASAAIAGIGMAGLLGCDGPQSALDPAGRAAEQIARLFWKMAAGAALVWLAMEGPLWNAASRRITGNCRLPRIAEMKTSSSDPEPLQHEPPRELQLAQEERLMKAWETPKGWRYWSAVNNTEVGLWYTATAFLFFLFGGVLAVLIRIQLAVPGNQFLSADFYNQVFTVHGSVMMFLFAIPMFEAIAVIFLPQMLGARDLPFPRLSAFG